MNQNIDAIYTDGVLKPLVPLMLPNNTQVKIAVSTEESNGKSEVMAKQQFALQEFRTIIQQSSQHGNNDGWSVRNHDQLLYGDSR